MVEMGLDGRAVGAEDIWVPSLTISSSHGL